MFDQSLFSFDFGLLHPDPARDAIATVPAGLRDERALFEALRQGLQLPAYFGNNWDALSECLRDLSWITPRRVILLHEDLPPMDHKAIKTYLEILSDSARDWKPTEDHELVVAFPKATRDSIVAIVKTIDR